MKTILILMALIQFAQARVGEPYVDFLKRGGFQREDKASLVRGLSIARHKRGQIEVTVYVFNETVCREEYRFVSREQAAALVELQAGKWEQTKDEGGEIHWRFKDGTAVYFSLVLRISTAEGEKLREELATLMAEKRKKERSKLGGF